MTRRVTVRAEVPPFAMVPEWLLEATIEGRPVSSNAIRVYAVLDRIAREKDETPPVSHAEIGRRAGDVKTATVKRAIGELDHVGAVTVRHKLDKLGKHPNSYLVHIRRREAQGSLLEHESASEPDSSPVNRGQLTSDPSMDSSPMTRPQVTSELQEPERSSEKKEGARPRNVDFDALAEETGHDLAALTDSAGGTIGTKLAEIRKAETRRLGRAPDPAELAEQIHYRAERSRRLHPEYDLTPGGLARRWATLGAKPVRVDRPKDPGLGPVVGVRNITPEESERAGAEAIADWRRRKRTSTLAEEGNGFAPSPPEQAESAPDQAGGVEAAPPAAEGGSP